MIWIGPLVGAALCARGGILGMLLGSLLGAWVERRVRYGSRESFAESLGREFSRFRRRPRGAADAPRPDGELARAYETLGLGPGATKAQAKRAYRKLAKECHPDAMRARGAGEREVQEATDRMARLNAAWNLICSSR